MQGNSTTTRQLIEALGLGAGYNLYQGHLERPSGLAHRAIYAGSRAGASRLGGGINDKVNRRVAEMLTSDDPTVYIRGAQTVARNPMLIERLRQISSIFGIFSVQMGTVLTE